MNRRKNEVFVWPIYTRIIHWLIVFSFTSSFLLSFKESYLNLHAAFGIIFGLMLLYRIIWGFVGPRYATFNTFKLSPAQLKDYFLEKIRNRWREIPAGHNPASSWFTLIVLGLGSIISLSGLLLYGIQEGKGYLGFLNGHYYMHMGSLANIHTYTSYILLAWVFLHISGVLIEQFYHKTDMVFAMITGYKKAKGEDSNPPTYKSSLSYIFLGISLMVFYVSTSTQENPFVASIFQQIDYEEENPLYFNKCGSCHKPYPPFMLPDSSWRRVQEGLSNHFGERITPDANKTDNKISLKQQEIIFDYLNSNSADKSTREISVKLMKSLDGNPGRKSITKMQYWKDTHADIPPNVFKSKKIKKKSNCFACHENFEKGMVEDTDIKIPK